MGSSGSSRIGTATKQLTIPWFVGFAVLFIMHYILQKSGVKVALIDSYLDDVLAMPVILTLAVAAMKVFYKEFVLSKVNVFFTVIYCSIVFEVALPYFSNTYTADIFDVVLYSWGAGFYWFVMGEGSRNIAHSG